jgi:hypothetical protein
LVLLLSLQSLLGLLFVKLEAFTAKSAAVLLLLAGLSRLFDLLIDRPQVLGNLVRARRFLRFRIRGCFSGLGFRV